ncbi:MAG TPA: iron ABC transporter permease [Bacteroidia bacterium]|jgi:iron complex transport system permease protein|nr:iron ABC transporter permease [Bacteroidia bacterium]
MKTGLKYILLLFVLSVLFVLDLSWGVTYIPIDKVFSVFGDKCGVNEAIVVLGFRLPKAIAALSAGMALSVAGMLMQTFFRNPLAGPYVLGINSLASLAVALLMLSAGTSVAVIVDCGIPFAASAGAFAGLLILLSLSRKIKSSVHLLMIGMMIGFLAGAIQSVLEYMATAQQVKNFILWNMASLSNVTEYDLVAFFLIVLITCLSCLFLIKPLNAMLLGHEQASLLGINTKAAKIFVLLATAILSGVTTAYCGPIGFVGLAMPYIVRVFFKTTNHLHQLFGCMLGGACFMLSCDIISNLPIFDNTLPINVITSLFGAPYVLWLIFKNKATFD